METIPEYECVKFHNKLNGMPMVGQKIYFKKNTWTYIYEVLKRNNTSVIADQKWNLYQKNTNSKVIDCISHRLDIKYCTGQDYEEYYASSRCDLGHEHR